jgi:2'-5' RNA ligase
LAHDIEAELEPLGIAKETRTFTAHLTLARIKEPVPLEALRNAITQVGPAEFGSFSIDCFYLFRSQPGSAGSIYTKLSEFPLQPE